MKKPMIIIIATILITGGVILQLNNIKKLVNQVRNDYEYIKDVESHYSSVVTTTSKSPIYRLDNGKYIEFGTIGKDVTINLSSTNINTKTKYFHINDLNLYIPFKNVTPAQKEEEYTNNNYKKYVKFNENVVTKDETSFYDSNGLYLRIKEGINLPIIIKDKNKYYVEYKDRLLYVKKDEVETKKTNNTKEEVRDKIRVLTYHTIYKENQPCENTVICHPYKQFDEHMKYLSKNKYLTLTMKELEMFLDGKIRIPIKSIVITLDDGRYFKNAVKIVEKYKVYATYFIITSVHDVSKVKSNYMDFESHTHNMHNNWVCPGGNQGGQFLCEDTYKAIKDLKKSQELLGGSKYLAYPFFDYNDHTFEILEKTGFKLAFIGQHDTDGYSDSSTHRYMIRRKTIFSDDTLDTFISYLK